LCFFSRVCNSKKETPSKNRSLGGGNRVAAALIKRKIKIYIRANDRLLEKGKDARRKKKQKRS